MAGASGACSADDPGRGDHRAALTGLLVEYGRSACRRAGRLLVVDGHGGNLDALRAAVTLLRSEGRAVAWFPCAVPAVTRTPAGPRHR